jgi:hypothetical protein
MRRKQRGDFLTESCWLKGHPSRQTGDEDGLNGSSLAHYILEAQSEDVEVRNIYAELR